MSSHFPSTTSEDYVWHTVGDSAVRPSHAKMNGGAPNIEMNDPENAHAPADSEYSIDALRYAQQSAAQRAAASALIAACYNFRGACAHPNGMHLAVALAEYQAATTPERILAALGVPVDPEGPR